MTTAMSHHAYTDSPLGRILITANAQGVTAIKFDDDSALPERHNRWTDAAAQQMQEYFRGQRSEFDLPLSPEGTQFQQLVWQALLTIPYGQTCSYADIAAKLNNPKAVRAVGAANGRNPIAIVVPCHRVIGANGTLTGYAGGLDRKARLLAIEAASKQPQLEGLG